VTFAILKNGGFRDILIPSVNRSFSFLILLTAFPVPSFLFPSFHDRPSPDRKAKLPGKILYSLTGYFPQGREKPQLLPGLEQGNQGQALPAAIGVHVDKAPFPVSQFVPGAKFLIAPPLVEARIGGSFDRGHEREKMTEKSGREEVSEKGSAAAGKKTLCL
jgi:hypothetical protein